MGAWCEFSGHLVKLEFHLPNGRVLTGVSASRTRVARFRRLPARGLFLGPRRWDVGDRAVTTGRISASSIILAAPLSGPIIEPSTGACSVMSLAIGDGSVISGGTVEVTAAALLGDQCSRPYKSPPATFTLNGKTFPLMPDGVLSSTMAPGYFVAFYAGTAPEPAGKPNCVDIMASSGGVPAEDMTVNPDATTSTVFPVCQG